ncbi:MAG: alcohol dehydrogenase catalytic domain-containing protein [Oscillospiraceae bacterium]|nr:alcohol dehydrogenase catalytic domain-containing protein [Oscillospiraceae bacterium]
MKALVLETAGKLVMKECAKPVPKNNEVLVKTMAATICTSDINDINYNPFGIELPMIMGHEGAGIIEKLGDEVIDFFIGDEIAAHPVMPCGKCVSCKRGLSHLCDDMEHLGLNHGGVFAEYFTIRADRIRKKPKNISFAAATLMEPVCVCIEAVKRANITTEKSNILVIGDGPFGIMIANICELLYPGNKIIVSGTYDFKLNYAGNAEKININNYKSIEIADEILKRTNGEGIDSAFICAGTGDALDTAIEACRSRGTVCMFSAIHDKIPVDMFKVHVKELNICGSCNDMDYLDDAIDILSKSKIAGVITHELLFDEYKKAFEIAGDKTSETLKVSMIF